MFEEIPSSTPPRVLVCVQAVDSHDPWMGYFVAWLRDAAKVFPSMIVMALRVGEDVLPEAIQVLPFRPKGSRSKWTVIWNLWKESWQRRREYDAVYVRGDAQYVLLAGWLWRLLGKRVVLWYAHYKPNRMVLPASWLAHAVVTSVPEACGVPRAHPISIGQAVQPERFLSVSSQTSSGKQRWLMLGRIGPPKRLKEVIQDFVASGVAGVELVLIGTPSDPAYAAEIKVLIEASPPVIWENRDVPYEEIPTLFSQFQALVSGTPSSLDKVIIEGLFSGLPVIAATGGLKPLLSTEDAWLWAGESERRVQAFRRLVALSDAERVGLGARLREAALQQHSFSAQLSRLALLLQPVQYPLLGLRDWIRRLNRLFVRHAPSAPAVRVLMFHWFDGKGGAATDVPRFLDALLHLKLSGYRFVSLSSLWDGQRWKIPEDNRAVLVTIDDATVDCVAALRACQAFGIPVTLCAPARLDVLNTSEGVERRVLGESDLKTLVREISELTVIGHGVTHRELPRLQENELLEEIVGTKGFVSRLHPDLPFTLAYPRGKQDDRVLGVLRVQGCMAGFTVQPGVWSGSMDPLRIPRLPMMSWMRPSDILRML